jgi:hypothetical protein
MGWVAPELVAAMHTADDFYLDLVAQVRMDRWTAGRVALVGDAGYAPCPLTGMGTSLALVGAYVLAGELGRHASHEAAFAAYEERMRPYVTQGQVLPPGGIRGYAPHTWAAIRNRIWSMKLMVSRPLRGLARKLFFAKAEAIDLPDYDERPAAPMTAPLGIDGRSAGSLSADDRSAGSLSADDRSAGSLSADDRSAGSLSAGSRPA